MERSFTVQLRASDASVANSMALALRTGSAPGRPRQTEQTLVLGAAPNLFAHPQKALVAVSSCTCTSRPLTGSYLSRTSGAVAAADMSSFYCAERDAAADGGCRRPVPQK